MNKEVCGRFKNVWTNFTYDSSKKSYQIKNDNDFKKYCNNQNCVDELEKINAGCLYLLNEFFLDSSSLKNHAKSNPNIVEYIMIWLSYILSLKKNTSTISHLQHYYDTYINGSEYYKQSINGVEDNRNYMDLLNKKKHFLDMDIKYISKFYEVFKLLCEIYAEFDENTLNCTNFSQKANTFAKKYNELCENSDITSNSPYNQLLSNLSTDYYNLKKKCEYSSSLPEITTKFFEQSSQVTLSSSTVNKLFIVLSIFGAIGIFLGISYKYSLFGFRKRFQKQKLKEKLKNIKKKMNH
ncbi:PIR protein [Plasmodium yoelii]|uniref:PIR protein n=2 Tax=Plasmodium yoelii TaxID=5861 RepID=A0AAE9WQA9_PLAYO|nr:PIR protein [Plasmodium yoelii]WBY58278.1 PIR protein [Plasmodium yoelii yoelii]CDS45012.1 YIR protein [Plasmodium yoelii]VTZ79197.1 PIR protein [Plasmodium yoelii]|eukprot:XP_022812764.2 PIR protein [Plasmodium yoelii]